MGEIDVWTDTENLYESIGEMKIKTIGYGKNLRIDWSAVEKLKNP